MIDSLVKLRGSIFSKFSAIQALLWRFTSARNLTIRSTARPVKPKSGQLPDHQVNCSPKLRSFSRKDWIIHQTLGWESLARVHGKREKMEANVTLKKNASLPTTARRTSPGTTPATKYLVYLIHLTHLSKQSNFTHLSNLSTYRLSEKLYIPVTSNPSIYLSYQSDLSF